MTDLLTTLQDVKGKVEAALVTAESDGASPVLVAVVREFAAKAEKALALTGDGRARDAVIELEQAGDSAKAAAAADTSATEVTTSAVSDAHLAICMAKANFDQYSA